MQLPTVPFKPLMHGRGNEVDCQNSAYFKQDKRGIPHLYSFKGLL